MEIVKILDKIFNVLKMPAIIFVITVILIIIFLCILVWLWRNFSHHKIDIEHSERLTHCFDEIEPVTIHSTKYSSFLENYAKRFGYIYVWMNATDMTTKKSDKNNLYINNREKEYHFCDYVPLSYWKHQNYQPDLLSAKVKRVQIAPQKITILLTTTVSVNNEIWTLKQKDERERLQIYQKSIERWLRFTDLNIVVVENSNYLKIIKPEWFKLYPNRLELISFQDPVTAPGKGQHELYAINYAITHSKLIHQSDFMVKVTGRYFIPELQQQLTTMSPKTQIISQHTLSRCEMIGAKKDCLKQLFRSPIQRYVESEYKKRMLEFEQIHTLPKMYIPMVKNGGFNEIVTYL